MQSSQHFNNVVFDVRDSANFLFFANTTDTGDIEDYLLIMRSSEPEFENIVIIETNEEQVVNGELFASASLGNGMLTLTFDEPVEALGEENQIILTFNDNPENRAAIEAGAFKVLGEQLTGGHA
jgi:hypothetical protein